MKILCLESYYGGSHKAFLDNWIAHTTHDWTLLTLPAYKWKWRMRHSAVTFAKQVNALTNNNQQWDILFTTDMLNLAEFKGLVNSAVNNLPSIIYFHENQLTYPVRFEKERDLHFGLTNFTSALSADKVWFNTEYHRESFLSALPKVFNKMPDYQPFEQIEIIKNKSSIYPQGINKILENQKKENTIPHLLWVARWEHDKNPEMFFEAIDILLKDGLDFKVSVIGEQFTEVPEVFKIYEKILSDKIINWGYLKSKEDYHKCLASADIVISTADHEFFGVSTIEAISAGVYPLLPNRLAYPEILNLKHHPENKKYFYDGTVKDLSLKLTDLCKKITAEDALETLPERFIEKYYWQNLSKLLDKALADVKS